MNTDDSGHHLKIISPTVHSVLDYMVVAVLLVAPSILELTGVFALAAYSLAAAHLLLTLTTRYAGGLFSGLSFRAHGVLEVLLAIGMIVSPWLFEFAGQADPRNFFLVLGFVLFALVFFTRFQPSQEDTDDNQDQPKATDTQPAEEDEVDDDQEPDDTINVNQ